jgi:hypothetical protein
MRWITIVTLMIAATAASQDRGTVVLSEPFVLKPKSDSKPPRLRVLEPQPGPSGTIVVEEGALTIKGVAVDENGIKKVEANGLTTLPSGSGGFVLKIPLDEGANRVTVRAEDNAGNDTTADFTVISDTKPPVISMIEPKGDATRGTQIFAMTTHIVRGKVADESGVREISINGKPVRIGADSAFWAEIAPRTGTDTVAIVAVDNVGHRAERTLILSSSKKPSTPDFLAFKNYALIIGIDEYRGKWPPLENAVRDAKAVADVLAKKFSFEKVHTLYNQDATRDRILSTLEYLAKSVGPDDNLLIYFSGHGRKEPPLNKGYWVPVDATEKSIGRYISNREIQDYLASMSARHVLLVADACFAGDIFKGNTVKYDFEDNEAYYRKVAEKKSRAGLTSGGDEPVLDGGGSGHSIFTTYFLRALDGIKKNYFSAEEVYQELKIPVANNSDQTPTFLPIKNTDDAGGQFIFVRR